MIRMNYMIILSCLLFALPVLVSGSDEYSAVTQSSQDNSTVILHVPDVQSILSNQEQYIGKTVAFKGLVSKTYPRQHQFTIADRVGCSLCSVEKDPRNSITVNYPGKTPKYMETIQISGLLTIDTYKRVIINATSVIP